MLYVVSVAIVLLPTMLMSVTGIVTLTDIVFVSYISELYILSALITTVPLCVGVSTPVLESIVALPLRTDHVTPVCVVFYGLYITEYVDTPSIESLP